MSSTESYSKTLRRLHPHPAYVQVWSITAYVDYAVIEYHLFPTRITHEHTVRRAKIMKDKTTVVYDQPKE